MPNFDSSGPMGAGPMTGGARGYCNRTGAGYGRGMAYGRGYRGGYGQGRRSRRFVGGGFTLDSTGYAGPVGDELTILKQEAQSIKQALDTINQRIAALDK